MAHQVREMQRGEMIVYQALNTATGKIYIGKTTVSLAQRKGDHKAKAYKHGSNSSFHEAMRKYGFDNFQWEIIDKAKTLDELNEKERYRIARLKTSEKEYGYNQTTGGDICEFNEEVKIKIGLAGKGRKVSEAECKRRSIAMRGKGNPFYGKKHTEEGKRKSGAKNIGRKLTPEHIAKCVHRGESNWRAVLKTQQVIQIKGLLHNGCRICDIARQYKVTQNTIKMIKYGISWRHVQV